VLSIRFGSRVFRPKWLPTLCVLPLLGLLLWLGTWQVHRAAEKQALYSAFEKGSGAAVPLADVRTPQRYLHVQITGHFVADHQILLDNMPHADSVGYRVLTPFVSTAGQWVLVDRGWVPAGINRTRLPDVSVPEEIRTLLGRVDEFPRPGVRLGAAEEAGWPRRMNFPTQQSLQRALGRPVFERLVLLDANEPDGYVRDWHPGGLPPMRHLGYAIQWFALALTLAVLYVFTQCVRVEIRT